MLADCNCTLRSLGLLVCWQRDSDGRRDKCCHKTSNPPNSPARLADSICVALTPSISTWSSSCTLLGLAMHVCWQRWQHGRRGTCCHRRPMPDPSHCTCSTARLDLCGPATPVIQGPPEREPINRQSLSDQFAHCWCKSWCCHLGLAGARLQSSSLKVGGRCRPCSARITSESWTCGSERQIHAAKQGSLQVTTQPMSICKMQVLVPCSR